jgi:hypothetical protein
MVRPVRACPLHRPEVRGNSRRAALRVHLADSDRRLLDAENCHLANSLFRSE